MSIDLAERLKTDWTDKYVVVADKVPELRRFVGLTGQVKTVNMSGRCLVQFTHPVDISWYDIDPTYLTIVAKPVETAKPATEKHAAEATKPAPAKVAAPAGKSPLEMARQQGAAGAAPAAPAKAKALSPLELARQQGAAGSTPTAEKPKASLSPLELARQQGAAKVGEAPAAAPAKAATEAAPAGKKLSPLELARQQGAAKQGGAAPAPVASEPAAAPAEAPAPPAAAPVAEKKPEAPAGKKLSPLELARQQGAFKG